MTGSTVVRNATEASKAERDPYLHRAAAILFWCLAWCLRAPPAWLAYLFADAAAGPLALWTLFHDRRGRRSGGFWRNVRIVYRPGGAGPHPPRGLLWRWARHMTWLAVDFCRIPLVTRDNVDRYIDLSELPRLREVADKGRGVIIATGHMGAPEVGGHAVALSGIPMLSVYQPSPIPAVNRILESIRGSGGQGVAPKWGVMTTLKRGLRDGKALGLFADVSSKGSRLYAPFLGTNASTSATPALLHLATGAPIAVTTVSRLGRMRFRLHVWDVIEHERTGDRAADVQAIGERMNATLSRAILDHPEQWFWHGRRFRYRPPGETPLPDGLPPTAGDTVSPDTTRPSPS